MIRRRVLVTSFLLLTGWIVSQLPASADSIKWVGKYETAVQQSKKSKKPLLIEFHADWCGPCRVMEKTTFRDKQVVAMTKQFVSVRVDVDKRPDLARKFGVRSIPFSVIVSPEGKVVRQSTGYAEPKHFTLFLKQGLPR